MQKDNRFDTTSLNMCLSSGENNVVKIADRTGYHESNEQCKQGRGVDSRKI